MALRLVIAPRAERDLDEIFAFVAADNEAAAAKILQQIEHKAFHLLERPFMGRRSTSQNGRGCEK